LRHSFASYHLAHFKNANELALEMGHTNSEMIFRHYRELVQPKEAARYWQITPADRGAGNVISFSDKFSNARRRM
jgi:integrase